MPPECKPPPETLRPPPRHRRRSNEHLQPLHATQEDHHLQPLESFLQSIIAVLLQLSCSKRRFVF
ncbi:hypothetical protein Hanom_Chr16g01480231 [Helianthus anomalus]